jgi:hypothetical protein
VHRWIGSLDVRDAHIYGGIALVAAGAGAVYWPAALIVAGAIVLALAVWRM